MPDVLMPRLSDTMSEGVLTQWLKQEGDQVHRGDVLAEIETDKATMELEAYDDGVLERLIVAPGTTVPIGERLAVIGDGSNVGAAGQGEPEHAEHPEPEQSEREHPEAEHREREQSEPDRPEPEQPEREEPEPDRAAGQVRTSPLARAIAREHGIDLHDIRGSGPGGRIVRADVEAAVAPAEAEAAEAPATPTRPAAARAAEADDEQVPLSAVRRVTAQRLTESAKTPHFYLTSVVDAGRLLAFRAEVNERLAESGTKISVTDLLVRACAVTLRAHPQANASWGGDHIARHRRIHVGIAVALEDGLIVPVLRDADRKSVGEIATEARALAERARAGKLGPDEFSGGTFTISNLGMYGIDHFTAVINPPEAAILAVGAATEEAVVRDGRLTAATTMKLTLSIDHRVLDGATAAAFLRDLRGTLEEPLRIVV